MKTRIVRTCGRAAFLAGCAALWCCIASPTLAKGPDIHLCQVVSGETVAEAVQGRIMESKAGEGKCIYTVGLPEAKGSAVFVVYRHDASDFEGLRAALEGEITQVAGLGDEAVLTLDKDARRFWLLAVKRGLVALQVSGGDKDQIRQVAEAALLQFAAQ